MALFRRKSTEATESENPEPAASASSPPRAGTKKKSGPTPTRKQAEAARRERLTRQISKKERARALRTERIKTMQARDNTPERALLRDYVDARRSIGEFLLPGMVLILAATFLYQVAPSISAIATAAMYFFILIVVADMFLMWRGFKKVLAERMPKSSTRGLLMYGMNRSIQIRRFRMPPPRIKRGEKY